MRSVLISVSERTGVVEFAQELKKLGFNIIATGGTRKFLESNEIKCKSISEVTGFPEILSGRVKTLHPKILGGILADTQNLDHVREVEKLGIPLIEIVVCNLYPFINNPEIENIDIGGITLIRAAAKNYKSVTCVTHPAQYSTVIEELTQYGKVSEKTRLNFACEAFKLSSQFDTHIVNFLSTNILTLSYEKVKDLKYGENPHQTSVLYKESTYKGLSLVDAVKLQGKELTFNNYYDLDAALSIVKSFDELCVCILKHATPCGVAVGDSVLEAYKLAYRCDTISPFGGIVASNREIDETTAKEIAKTFMTAILAPKYTNKAKEVFAKKKNLVLLELDMSKDLASTETRWINGGLLVQDSDISSEDTSKWETVTNRKPTADELKAMKFGVKVVKFVKSNAVIVTTDKMTLGIGGGQPNRVGALEIAFQNMKKFGLTKEEPKVVISDALFPFRDSIDVTAKEGVKAVIQPGGSIRDQEVIDACNEHGIAMVFTHRRYFKH
jgi:phosphoribosylaminoimidazolecarboxamide formyltransferase/IMP cyclohydrolase